MREYGFSLTRILPYGTIRVSENPYSRIFYAVEVIFLFDKTVCWLVECIIKWLKFIGKGVKKNSKCKIIFAKNLVTSSLSYPLKVSIVTRPIYSFG